MSAAGDWVQNRLNEHARRLGQRKRNPVISEAPVLSEFQHHALATLVRAMGTGIYNLPIKWERGDYSYDGAVHVVMYGSLASYDFNHLTRLVIAAHDACVRVSIEARARRYIGISLHRRQGREGDMSSRHPTIEQAIEAFRQ